MGSRGDEVALIKKKESSVNLICNKLAELFFKLIGFNRHKFQIKCPTKFI